MAEVHYKRLLYLWIHVRTGPLWISIGYVEPKQIFEWIGCRRSNKNYFTLSKSCYLCISVFLSLLLPSAIGLFFSLCSFGNLLHNTRAIWMNPVSISNSLERKSNGIERIFWKCNIEMLFLKADDHHQTTNHWNAFVGCISSDSRDQHICEIDR